MLGKIPWSRREFALSEGFGIRGQKKFQSTAFQGIPEGEKVQGSDEKGFFLAEWA